jgi:hypothetical protein
LVGTAAGTPLAVTKLISSVDDSSISGSVNARAGKYSWYDEGRDLSGGFQHTQNRCDAAKESKPTIVGGDLLIGSAAGTEKVTQLVVGPAEFAGRSWALEPAHLTVSVFDAAMILLEALIEIPAVAMQHIRRWVIRRYMPSIA